MFKLVNPVKSCESCLKSSAGTHIAKHLETTRIPRLPCDSPPNGITLHKFS